MHRRFRVLIVSHGYPPWESAGTEQHVQQLAHGLTQRGHVVHVLAATRAPGRRQYAVVESPGLTRIVNNVPTRQLGDGEQDGAIDRITAQVAARFAPDVVHVHHIQFLSSGMRFSVPVVATLHDGWAWCAAGGQGLRPDGTVCPGPRPEDCAPCATAWAPSAGALTSAMVRMAGWAAPVVPPERLHGWYQRIPAQLRPRPERGTGPAASPEDAALRNAEVGAFFQSASVLVAPSQFLAKRAEAQGMGPVLVIPHGIVPASRPAARSPRTAGPFLHLGTIAAHKGTDRVVQAWRDAFPNGQPELRIHGPVDDIRCALDHPVGPVLDREGVAAALRTARALVLAPRWEENAPLVIVEARAHGCPVIAPASGGIPELVDDGVDGILFDPADPAALRTALTRAVDDGLPVPRHPPTFDDHLDQVVNIYAELLRRAATGTGA
jgi:glycosyltransferase involved in cell wall biosynthesis